MILAWSRCWRRIDPSEQEIVRAMNGHIYRCGVYQRIVAAIKDQAG